MSLTFKDFLRSEVTPALGCTEPGAVALSVARACEELEEHCTGIRHRSHISLVIVEVSDSIYKNGHSVGIPGADGRRGNTIAAALGACCGRSAYGLEVLRDCTLEDAKTAEALVHEGRVRVVRMPGVSGVYVKAAVSARGHKAECVIQSEHSRITRVTYDGRDIVHNLCTEGTSDFPRQSVSQLMSELSYVELMHLVDEIDEEDERYLLHGARICSDLAKYWLSGSVGGEGNAGGDPCYMIRQLSCAAAAARMAGAPLPAMSSAGSGNHGITAILPVTVLGRSMGKADHDIATALAVSHISTSHVKSKLGRLTPVCGCAVAAGSGAAAGMVRLLGGNISECEMAMQMVLAGTFGMICDGAKETCSLKVGVGATEAYFAACAAVQGRGICADGGVTGASLQETIDNITQVSRKAMKDVDGVIIGILESRQ